MTYNCSFPFSNFISIEVYVFFIVLVFGLFVYSFYVSGLLERGKVLGVLGVVFLVLGGSYNLYHRLVEGCVADPLSFFGIFSFNYADISVNLGFLLLLLVYIKSLISPIEYDT
ncbi:hypothetical protein GF360_03955 [candidate division WWE3 bacterium]|nr:hypothetical protein [candidate division WWE3 bacterium]